MSSRKTFILSGWGIAIVIILALALTYTVRLIVSGGDVECALFAKDIWLCVTLKSGDLGE